MKIVEIWKPGMLGLQMISALGMGFWAVKSQNPIWIVFSVIFAWQAGWGVKLDVEVDRLKKEGKL